jgi:ABC-type transport system substrate-binding protein
VVASFERVRAHPRSPLRYLLAGVSRVVAENDRVVVVETAHPVPDLLNRLAFVAVIPRRLAAEREIASPEGTGSYRFLGRGAGGSIEGEAFAGWRGRPPISRVAFVFDEGSEAATTRFLAGKLDVLHLLPEELAGQVRKTPGLRVEPQSSLGVQILAVYPRNAPGPASRALADPRVRRAMLLALDRQGWIDRLAGGRTTVASQYVHPVVFGHDTSIAPMPFDPPLARKLLAEAGYGRGFEAVLGHTRIQAAVAQSIAEDLARVGIRVTLLPARAGELTELAVTGRISLQLFQWACGTGDASDFLTRFVPSPGEATERTKLGYWGLSDARLEALVAAAGEEIDPEKRRSLLQQAQREMLRGLPMLPLALRYANRGVSSRVEVVDRYDERQVVASFRWRR